MATTFDIFQFCLFLLLSNLFTLWLFFRILLSLWPGVRERERECVFCARKIWKLNCLFVGSLCLFRIRSLSRSFYFIALFYIVYFLFCEICIVEIAFNMLLLTHTHSSSHLWRKTKSCASSSTNAKDAFFIWPFASFFSIRSLALCVNWKGTNTRNLLYWISSSFDGRAVAKSCERFKKTYLEPELV